MSETETSSSDHDLYARQGIGSQIGFGEHPAVIVVDYQLAFTRGPLAGDYPEAALQATARIASAARAVGAPVAYSYCAYERDLSDAGPFGVKCPGLAACERGSEGCLIDPVVTPAGGDLVFEKQQPSAFFGTPLHEHLRERGIDTVVVCGTTTSGCVRATVVDGMSLGYRIVVPVEAVSDRARTPHRSALFDMGHKYADVLPERDVVAALASRARG
jgi:nicotinamidase-related amidase